uniref:Anaphase-promoting complex subunit 4 n=2 Tax=Aceria tosichella TaxID=561515 RepID=A0A6G1SHX7_9ACAR
MQYPKLVESKTAANEVAIIEWNPGMDLLATVFTNGALTCSRLLSLQKVWHKQPCGKVVSVAWRPDGRVLALGAYDEKTKENVCTLYDVEDGKEIHSITMTCNITSVAWFSCSVPGVITGQQEKEDPIRPKKSTPSNYCDPVKENFSHQLAHEQTQLNTLMISTSDGRINFYALGLFYLGRVSVSDGPQIYKTHMSSCMQFITSILNSSSNPENGNSILRVLKFDTFNKRSKEILNVSRMYAKITDELEYLEDTLSAIKTSWTDVLAGLDNKLSSYCSRRSKKPDESDTSYTFISADDLLQLLVLGTPSDNLEKFLADMSDKGLRKLNNAIEQTCLRVQNLIVKNAQKCCYHLHKDLNQLRGMSLWRERYSEVGLDDKSIVEAMRDVGVLMLKLTELQQVIDHSLKSTKSFFRWLISIACRLTGEQNNSAIPNDVNKTTQQDIQLITDFILENFDYNTNQDELGSFLSRDGGGDNTANDSYANRPTCSNFTLEQVGQYFKNESLTRLKYSFTRPESNFWIEFFKQRPDITELKVLEEDGSSVLLFYPHRADTSLVQEHKRASSSIATAFDSVASNFEQLLDSGSYVINLNDFIRNAPANKIRVETDVQSMTHHTIFQTKPGPVTRQYLISQSLLDKSFKLISVEFQTNLHNSTRQSRLSTQCSAGNIVITDSCFYENKESRKMLMTFLLIDQTANDTVIVQIELSKLLEGANSSDRRPHKDLGKVFRTNDTIDKHSLQQILRLDLQTDPAYARKHDPEMMVKKIKGVVARDMFASSSRGVIAFTSSGNKRLHIYELESMTLEPEIIDDEIEGDDKVDESLIDTDLLG